MDRDDSTQALALDCPGVLRLTPREQRAVELAAGGATQREIALALGSITEGQVRAIFARPAVREAIEELRQAFLTASLAARVADEQLARATLRELAQPPYAPGIRLRASAELARLGVEARGGATVNVQVDARTQTHTQITVTPEQLERLPTGELDALLERLSGIGAASESPAATLDDPQPPVLDVPADE